MALTTDTYMQIMAFCPKCDQLTECDAQRTGPPWIAKVKCIACGTLILSGPCAAPH
jgi:hypothetical protein